MSVVFDLVSERVKDLRAKRVEVESSLEGVECQYKRKSIKRDLSEIDKVIKTNLIVLGTLSQ